MSPRKVAFALVLPLIVCTARQSLGQPTIDSNVIQTDVLVIMKVRNANEFIAYSKSVGKWQTFAFPAGVIAKPVFGKGVCAFYVEGESITEVVAVDLNGNWCPFKLDSSATKCMPFMSDDIAGFIVNGQVHAFSGALGKWDSIEATVVPELSRDSALILTADSIGVFSAATAKWAVAKTTK